jgi:tetratricopeptide (TPR) repeat protein
LLYHQAGQYWQSIGAAQEALRRRPDYAEAYNNIAAAYESLGMWNQAIEAAQEALRIRPDFQLASNNLAWAEVHRCRKSPVPP